jgi:hypothetical protein
MRRADGATPASIPSPASASVGWAMNGGRDVSDVVLRGGSSRRAAVAYYPSEAFLASGRRTAERMAMTAAVVTLTVAQLLDLGTFIRMMDRHGAAAEANPLVSHLMSQHGIEFVAVTKIVALALVVAVTVVLAQAPPDRPGHPRLARLVVAVAVVVGIVGGWTNAATLI